MDDLMVVRCRHLKVKITENPHYEKNMSLKFVARCQECNQWWETNNKDWKAYELPKGVC